MDTSLVPLLLLFVVIVTNESYSTCTYLRLYLFIPLGYIIVVGKHNSHLLSFKHLCAW